MLFSVSFVRNKDSVYRCVVDASLKVYDNKSRNLMVTLDAGTDELYLYELPVSGFLEIMLFKMASLPKNLLRGRDFRTCVSQHLSEYHWLENMMKNDGLLDKKGNYVCVIDGYRNGFKPMGFGGAE